ncbi:MAG: family 43 glycosylhydrolase [Anaerolineae bacterium]
MRLNLVLVITLLTASLLISRAVVFGQAAGKPGTFQNPLNANAGADPWLTYYDGYYYLAATTWTSEWYMRKSPTLAGLKTAEPVRIYFESDPSRCCNFWAPEFRLLDGPNGKHWYFYYSAGSAGTLDNQHIHVLESAGTDPMGPYTYKGRLYDPQNDTWLIDGSVMELNESLYFLASAFVNSKQSLVIAPLSDPWTFGGPRSVISQPELPWELVGGNVNEGPVSLYHDGKTFIIYSASSCNTPDYKLGMLTYNGGNPVFAQSWVKNPEPVFQRSDENGVFAPGHNGFFKSPDGTEDWIVYHANDSVSYGCDGRRSTRVQKINWKVDGKPDFGIPASTDDMLVAPSGDGGIDLMPEFPLQVITQFKTYSATNRPTAYLQHAGILMRLAFRASADTQFKIVPGLANPDAVSIESVNFPSYYLRLRKNIVTFGSNDDTDTFVSDVTWWMRSGLADESALSLESYSVPGSYISNESGILALSELTEKSPLKAREDATFVQEDS